MSPEPSKGGGRRIRRPASITDVAREAGVSATTVSHVLSGKRPVNEATATRVRSVVTRMGYVPASMARSLQMGSTSVIGLLVPDISNTFFAELAKGVEDGAHAMGYSVILCNTVFDPEREDHYLNLIRGRFIDALVYSAGSPPSMRRVEALRSQFPVALVDEYVDGLDTGLMATADHRHGGQLLGAHLADLGHKRALILSGPLALRSAADRTEGFCEAFGGDVTVLEGAFTEASGNALVTRTIEAEGSFPYTCVFAANDLAAFGAILALRQAGLRIPADVSVVGFDDIRAASLADPALTTVRQPAYDVGRTAVTQLLQYVAVGEMPPASRHILPVHLNVRASSGPPARR